jgi:hypothetical protein
MTAPPQQAEVEGRRPRPLSGPGKGNSTSHIGYSNLMRRMPYPLSNGAAPVPTRLGDSALALILSCLESPVEKSEAPKTTDPGGRQT